MNSLSRRQCLRRFFGDETGSISIEFMITIPLLLFVVTGGIAYFDAFHSVDQTSKVAFAVSDIMSRHDVVDDTDMNYLTAVLEKMLPADLTRRTLRISSICFEDDLHRVLWSYTGSSNDIQTPSALTDEEVPVELLPAMSPQDSVILIEVATDWEPYFLNVGLTTKRWRSDLVSRPRFVKIIPHATLNPSNICPNAE